MSYQVLARKWRPKSFKALVGQENAVQALMNALDQKRLHHAYLFNGTRGIGKTTIARILAKSLNCEQGISSTPCQKCSTCEEIDLGRYVDLIELDAASNTGVDNMIDLLENAQYAPSSGRFKVYIIDEVHMLSKSAFNAMLKTLEEPPEHVKFILATTEIQKIPVTILSRCLQFNLRQMTSINIENHLLHILEEENIKPEKDAIALIAKASMGSMRDALTILDQAIAFSSDNISTEKVSNMLGTIDDDILFKIIQHLTDHNGSELNKIAREMEKNNISFEGALNDLSKIFHNLSVCKVVPEYINELGKKNLYEKLIPKLSSESIQLFYQICLHGKKDMHLAPDPVTGFSMTLLRMLVFYPTSNKDINNTQPETNIEAHQKKSLINETVNVDPSHEKKKEDTRAESIHKIPEKEINIFDGNWSELVAKLKIGLGKSLAQECQLVKFENNIFYLSLDEKQSHMSKSNYQDKLEELLINHFNKKVSIQINVNRISTSPSKEKKIKKEESFKEAESAIMQDDLVKELISDFNAEIIPSSIEPIKKGK